MENLLNKIHHTECISFMQDLPNGSIDCILTDPPYLYLKGQKLEREFDEQEFFKQAKRVLREGGFVVLFGRGTSFYRWNTILANLGFEFKEEIVWDKINCSSPVHPLGRVHETISVWTKGKGVIQKSKIPYLEIRKNNTSMIIQDMKRVRSLLNNNTILDNVLNFLENGIKYSDEPKTSKHCATSRKGIAKAERAVEVLEAFAVGMNEKSIISQGREHLSFSHPTQKPVRLLERLLALVTKPGDIVLDPFSGSGSTAVACMNTDRRFIACEIDSEYYQQSVDRINNHLFQPKLF